MDCTENNLPNGIDSLEIDDLKPLGAECSAAEDATISSHNNNIIRYPRHQRRSVYLFEKLQEVEEQLKEKELQCESLTKEQLQTGEEVQELTAALFEEANKMVQDANIKRRQAEKQLEDSLMKIEVLQAEVTALKKIILNSTTPNSPNFIKSPQLVKSSSNSNFSKGHKRSISHHSTIRVVDDIDNSAPYDTEIDLSRREKFRTWKAYPTLNPSAPFIEDIVKNEINPCLAFKNDSLIKDILEGIMNNKLSIEPNVRILNDYCSLSLEMIECTYVVKLEDNSKILYPVSTFVRNRIATVCNLISYLRYITLGLVKINENEMFQEIVNYLLQMSAARLGLKV